jgi:hypothetical protein
MTKKKMNVPEVEYTIIATQDIISVRGNACASGDDAFDKEVEDSIIARLDDGDVWAWASVDVCAKLKDFEGFEGHAYLGGCSYKDEADFSTDDGYLPQMKEEALEDLKATLRHDAKVGLLASSLLARFK